ncbi:MAG: hypothetical protein RBU45_19700 [Myxococcota bacterium]|jgi:hypothetical protein|nr:hypothetical protein [Myxococcota bacterium]
MKTLRDIFRGGHIIKAQLDMIDLFNVKDTLFQRGLEFISEDSLDDTLLSEATYPAIVDASAERQAAIRMLDKLDSKDFRIQIRAILFGSSGVQDLEGLHLDNSEACRGKYSKTIELLLAYLCVTKLKAFSASFGVKIKGAPEGGDFDCIANFQNSLFHFEAKSGDASNLTRKDVENFLARHEFLNPHPLCQHE